MSPIDQENLTGQAREAIKNGIPAGELFTPILKGTDQRIVMQIENREDITRGPGFKGVVWDKVRSQNFRVFGRPCNLDNCYCDAEVEVIQ